MKELSETYESMQSAIAAAEQARDQLEVLIRKAIMTNDPQDLEAAKRQRSVVESRIDRIKYLKAKKDLDRRILRAFEENPFKKEKEAKEELKNPNYTNNIILNNISKTRNSFPYDNNILKTEPELEIKESSSIINSDFLSKIFKKKFRCFELYQLIVCNLLSRQ